MSRFAFLPLVLASLGLVAGCGSSSSSGNGGDAGTSTGTSTSGDDGGSSSNDDAGGGSTSEACSGVTPCTVNGTSISCGASACIDGTTYSCNATGLGSGGTCATTPVDSGSTTPTLSCPKTDNSSSSSADACDATTQYCVLGGDGTLDESNPSTISYAHCMPLPSGCDFCDCAEADAKKNVESCSGSSMLYQCQYTNGAVTVSCAQE